MTDKLKTLETIELEEIIPFYLSETNEIEDWNKWSFEHLVLNIRSELKAEAIKDIKFLETAPEDIKEFHKKEDDGINYFCLFDAMASHDNSNVIEYIKWKNNITEEELNREVK